MRANYDRGFEHAAKADEMRARAANIDAAAGRAIYSDDPDATDRLAARVAELEAQRDRIKAYNATCKRGAPDLSILTDRERAQHLRTLELAAWQCKGGAFPAYALSNLGAEIRRNRARLDALRGGQ